MSATLLAATPEQFDAEMDRVLERFVLFLGAERGSLALFDPDGTLRLRQSFVVPGIPPPPAAPDRDLPNWVAHARAGSGVLFRRPEELPAGWTEERAYVRKVGMKSHAMFPLRVGGTPIGTISVSSLTKEHDWPERLLARFQLFGEILANAIVGHRKERDLRASLEEISRLKERLEVENRLLREDAPAARPSDEIVGQSPALRQVLHLAEQVASTNTTVLLTGETGTGKELIARAIHTRSRRSRRPFVAVNCAALPGTLIESELFGYERGAFTGAMHRRIGRFELAHEGTIFLDEIGDLPLDFQGRLLRVLQEGRFERLGSSQTIKVDTRVIAATNRDLAAAVRQGRWHADLFFRLNVFPIELPPLRERREDIPLLVWFFVTRKGAALGRRVTTIPERTMAALRRYEWPGNVRELENAIERALILSSGESLAFDERVLLGGDGAAGAGASESLDAVEREHILRVLGECGWRVAGRGNAAERLGLNRSTLRSRMEKLGIRRPAGPARTPA
ncbi:MAG TPA: sigma 54-interacting transcriptional regulator [Thermoanaerobaculia bacterium]|nr:sigma 54-interacting transcriptional regulator [Thermoanaerobaculia bacterium]HQR66634.1 sigma 54-interacting transcriptional regulator [Thermoanaerobaculia bacterium]